MLEPGGAADTWDGVDCALYFGGPDAASAKRVIIEQLKYSGASPDAPWTVTRLTYTKAGASTRAKEGSVIRRLAKAWLAMRNARIGRPPPSVALITNQPIAPDLIAAVERASTALLNIPPASRRANLPDETRLAIASGLPASEFREFAASFDLNSGAGSRFAVEDRVLKAMAAWTDQDTRNATLILRQFVRERMLPEHERLPITQEAVLLHALGASDVRALFPCPAVVKSTTQVIRRASVEAMSHRVATNQHLCVHGEAASGRRRLSSKSKVTCHRDP